MGVNIEKMATFAPVLEINTYTNLEQGAVLLIDKPYTWTSFNVVSKVRWLLKRHTGNKRIKVGHAGTLDPLATGLLVVCVGKATKQVPALTAHDKVYEATLRLGQTTPSFDLETEVDAEFPIQHITPELVRHTARCFVGQQQQVPPSFSAKLIDGKRAYELARKGVEVELRPAHIEIFDMEVLEFAPPMLRLRVHCSKGTYIRALARDLGLALGSGAHLTQLRRTASGKFSIEQALTINELEKIIRTAQPSPQPPV